MSVEKLRESAQKHLYAGELLHKFATDMGLLMEHMSEAEMAGAVKVRQIVMDYAESELLIARSLCDIAENEAASC